MKILTKLDTKEKNRGKIESLNLDDIDMTDDLHNTFIKETLVNFNQVICLTTTHIWEHE